MLNQIRNFTVILFVLCLFPFNSIASGGHSIDPSALEAPDGFETELGPIKAKAKRTTRFEFENESADRQYIVRLVNGDGREIVLEDCSSGSFWDRLRCKIRNVARKLKKKLFKARRVQLIVNDESVFRDGDFSQTETFVDVPVELDVGENNFKVKVRGAFFSSVQAVLFGSQVVDVPIASFNFVADPEKPGFFDFDASASTSGSPIVSYTWDFGDGSEAIETTEPSARHFFDEGTYVVTLTVLNDSGSEGSTTRVIEVDPLPPNILPTARIFSSPFAELGVPVRFFTTSRGDPDGETVEYRWSFGDGTTAVTTVPEVFTTYENLGFFNISLVVVDNRGGVSDPSNNTVKVVGDELVPEFFFSAGPGPAPLEVTGRNVSITGGGATIVRVTWIMSDGTVIENQDEISHTFTATGEQSMTMEIEDDKGRIASKTIKFAVFDETNNPVAVIEPDPPSGPGGPFFFFGENSASPIGAQITQYDWNFGDGNTGSGSGIFHTFSGQGVFNVTLTVTDQFGNQGSTTIAHDTFVTPEAVIVSSPPRPVEGLGIIFSAVSTLGIENVSEFRWFVDGEGPFFGETLPPFEGKTGTFGVTLEAVDTRGGVSLASKTVTVEVPTPPEASILAFFDSDQGTKATNGQTLSFDELPAKIHFNAVNSEDDFTGLQYSWDFGDGNVSNEIRALHSYLQEGLYNVSLTVTNKSGLSSSASMIVEVVRTIDGCLEEDGDNVCPRVLESIADTVPADLPTFTIATDPPVEFSVNPIFLSPFWISLENEREGITIDLSDSVTVSGTELIVDTAAVLGKGFPLDVPYEIQFDTVNAAGDNHIAGRVQDLRFGVADLTITIPEAGFDVALKNPDANILISRMDVGTTMFVEDLPAGTYSLQASGPNSYAFGSFEISSIGAVTVAVTPVSNGDPNFSGSVAVVPGLLLASSTTSAQSPANDVLFPELLERVIPKGDPPFLAPSLAIGQQLLALNVVTDPLPPEFENQSMIGPQYYPDEFKSCGTSGPFPASIFIADHFSRRDVSQRGFVSSAGAEVGRFTSSGFIKIPPVAGNKIQVACNFQAADYSIAARRYQNITDGLRCCKVDCAGVSIPDCVEQCVAVKESVYRGFLNRIKGFNEKPINLLVEVRNGADKDQIDHTFIRRTAKQVFAENVANSTEEIVNKVTLPGEGFTGGWGLSYFQTITIPEDYAAPEIQISFDSFAGVELHRNFYRSFCNIKLPLESGSIEVSDIIASEEPGFNTPIPFKKFDNAARSLAKGFSAGATNIFPTKGKAGILPVDIDAFEKDFVFFNPFNRAEGEYLSQYNVTVKTTGQQKDFNFTHVFVAVKDLSIPDLVGQVLNTPDDRFVEVTNKVEGGDSITREISADFELPISIFNPNFNWSEDKTGLQIDVRAVEVDNDGLVTRASEIPFSLNFLPNYNIFDVTDTGVFETLCPAYSTQASAYARYPIIRLLENFSNSSTVQFRCNDGALPYGGKFDPHSGHKEGLTLDVRFFGQGVVDSPCDRISFDCDNFQNWYSQGSGFNRKADALKALAYHNELNSLAVPLKDMCIANPDEPDCPVRSIEVDRFVDWIVRNRVAFQEIKNFEARISLRISTGHRGLNAAQGINWQFNALNLGVIEKGGAPLYQRGVDGLEPIGDCLHTKNHQEGSTQCDLSMVDWSNDQRHFSHIDMKIVEESK